MSDKSKSISSLYQITQNQTAGNERTQLTQIKDLNGMLKPILTKSKVRQSFLRSSNGELSTKKAPIRNIQNKQNKPEIDDGVLKMISYGNLCRNIQQKNTFIEKQRQEILLLKECLNDIKKNHQIKLAEDQRVRKEQIAKLKQQQKEYSQNLRDLQMMRGHFREIKKKYESLNVQKQTISEKYAKAIHQNEQLTVIINNLKQQLELSNQNQQVLDLQQEVAHLREDIRNFQLQKESNEIRSSNFQKRMNQYILKYNQLQGNLSQSQIKYYKLQKDCDNLKIDKEEVEQKLINLQRQCEGERQIHADQLTIIKGKLKKYQDELCLKDQKIKELLQSEVKNDLAIRVQQLSQQLKRISEINLALKQQNSLQVKKWERYIKQMMRQCSQQSQDKLRKQKLQYEQILFKKQKDLITQIQKKNQLLKSRNEEIANYQTEISDLEAQLIQQRQQQQKILQKIGLLEKQINQGNDYLQSQNQILKSQVQTYSNKLQQALNMVQTKDQVIRKLESEQIAKEQSNKKLVVQFQYLRKQNEQLQLQKMSLREQQFKEKRYYQQKYEKQIEQYNTLSVQFNQLQNQNRKLLKINSENTIEISNLKAQLHVLKEEIDKLIRNQQNSQHLKTYVLELEKNRVEANEKLNINQQKINQIEQYLSDLRQQVSSLRQQNLNLKEQYDTVYAQKDQLAFKLNSNLSLHLNQQTRQENQIRFLQDKLKMMQEDILAKAKSINQKDIIIGRIKEQLQQHVQEIRYLTETVLLAEKKYQNMVNQYTTQTHRWENEKNTWKWQLQCHQNQKKVLQHSRISADYELDSSQTMVEILRQENKQLQLILGGEIERRNATIRELINEKKMLFEQLMQKN